MRRFVAAIMMLLLLLGKPSLAAPSAPSSSDQSETLSLTRFDFQRVVKAGQTITFRVEVDVAEEVGACCGRLTLQGPSGQFAHVELTPSGPRGLAGTYTVNPHAEPGTWYVGRLSVQTNDWRHLELTAGPTWKQQFTVVGLGKVVDTTGPQVLSLSLPERATVGEVFAIRVEAKDNLSGVEYGYAVVQPAMPAPPSREGVKVPPPWRHLVRLLPTGEPGELAGRMVMESPPRTSGSLEVVTLMLADRAGNATVLDQTGLAQAKFRTTVAANLAHVPEGLITSPFLDVIHGRLAYQRWLAHDRAYLTDLVTRIPDDPKGVREHLLAELVQLRAALEQVRGEVYTDPASGLRAVPFATTGKWLVLDRAIKLRTYLLARTGEGSAPVTPADVELWQALIWESYQVAGPDGKLLPLEGSQLGLAQVAVSYLSVLSRSPEAVAVLRAPYQPDAPRVLIDDFDGDLVYFMPVETPRLFPKMEGRPALWIPAISNASMTQTLSTLYMQLGYHLGEVLFSPAGAPDRAERWKDYVELRGGHNWLEGEVGLSPANNLAVDFAQTFLPDGLEFVTQRSYPDLNTDPALKEAFRAMVTERLWRSAPMLEIAPKGNLQVGVADRLTLSVSAPGAQTSLVLLQKAWTSDTLNQAITGSKKDGATVYTSQPQAMGEPYWHLLQVRDERWGDQYRLITYVSVPVLLDPLPAATNQPAITITGTTRPGKVVYSGFRSVRADQQGRFAITVPLAAGENVIRLGVSGESYGVRVRVAYQPESSAIPVSWEIPATTRFPFVVGKVTTTPYAIVKLNDQEYQANEMGELFLIAVLKQKGENTVRLVVTDRYGNSVIWEKQVIREE